MHSLYKNQLISILENLSFGSHICFFYQNKEELIDILISYFKEGIKNNEYCIWINSEQLQTSQIEINLKEILSYLFEIYLVLFLFIILPILIIYPISSRT